MKKLYGFFLLIFIFQGGLFQAMGQVVSVTNPTNVNPNLTATYGSLAAAITAINAATTISGPVTITLNTGNSQTAPVGGYAITATPTGISSTNKIVFEGSGNTITAFTPQTSGRLYDAIFKLIGCDFVTIQNFIIQENSLNTTYVAGTNNMTEWGIALLHKSVTDGAQNNVIQNNTISLNVAYQNSFGIYSNARHSATLVNTLEEITNNTTGPNSNNHVYTNSISNVNMGICFIGAGVAAGMDAGNDIGGSSAATGNSITNWGGAALAIGSYYTNSGTFYGIFMNNQVSDNISYNTITSAIISGTTTTVRGIHKRYNVTPTATFTSNITHNSISITDNNASGNLNGIFNDGITPTPAPTVTININDNSFINNSAGGVGSAITMVGILNSSRCGVLNINNNLFRGNSSAATTGNFTAIASTDSVQTTLNINNNKIGDALGDAINLSAVNASAQTVFGINAVASYLATISISNNDFRGFVHTAGGSWIHNYINYFHASAPGITDNINSNTFTNLVANTTGDVAFIKRSGTMVGATENCNGNQIIGTFSKTGFPGTVTLYAASGSSLVGNTMVQTGNDFSNITLTGTTIMAGWLNTEGNAATTGPAKTINNNIFNNWTCGSGAVNVIQSNNGNDNTTISGNNISNITADGNITAILLGSTNKGTTQGCLGNTISTLTSTAGTVLGITGGAIGITTLSVNNNNINTLSTSGATQVEAIKITAATTINLQKNKIYGINAQNAACTAFGIDIATSNTGATYNITNNIVGNITAPLTNNALAIRGISVSMVSTTSTFNIYYNTVYLNANSSGTDFGTAALYLVANGTATSGAASVRNNILVNLSTSNGTGVSASLRRSGTSLINYAASSNNNIFYAGAPSAFQLIYYDGTNADQTLASFKARVTTRESASFTEQPPFLSLVGSSPDFLHLDPAVATQAESGAVNITGYTNDIDGNIRQGNPGYAGAGTAPDIGADELEGTYTELNPPVISYTTITTPTCTFSGMSITGVTITDATGIPLSGANRPRIYYRKNAGSWFSRPGTNTAGTATSSTWSFTIVEADMGGVSGGDVISYYIIAQDNITIPNVGATPSAGLAATSVNSVSTAPTTPNAYTLLYNMSGTYTVGAGGNFTTLTAAVSAYNNACSLAGATIFELIDDTYPSETFPISINNHADASATNTLTIRPSSTATPVITGTTTTQTINLNGAKYIRIDGRRAGLGTTRAFTITNASTAISINFTNDAKNNVIRYCIIKGQKPGGFTGTIVFGASDPAGTGNDNNTIDNNEISEAGGFSTNGIYSSGTPGRGNDNNIITNNLISNYYNGADDTHGIYVVSSNSLIVAATAWTISNNRFFQTATKVYTLASNHFGVYITTGSGYTISNNVVGFANESGTGTTNLIGNSVSLAGFPTAYSVSGTATLIRYFGIAGSFENFGTPSSIDGNTVGGFAMYTSSTNATAGGMFCGIYVESGSANIGVNAGNIIGATSGNHSIYVATSGVAGTITGIRAACLGTAAIQNNIIGSILSSGTSTAVSGSFTGITVSGFCSFTITNNTIGNGEAGNIRIGHALTGGFLSNAGTLVPTNVGVSANFYGIISSSSGNTLAVNNNTIRGWTMSCAIVFNKGIETTGALTGLSASVNVNNNIIGTSSVNWLHSTVNNGGFVYTINVTNTGATTYNIKDNNIQGTFFGTQSSVGGVFIRLTAAATSNNISTISGNRFTNNDFRFSSATWFFIFTNGALSSTGRLVIDDNKIVGNFTLTGDVELRMLHSNLNTVSGSQVNITNNGFENISASGGFYTGFNGLYSFYNGNPCTLTVSNNIFNNWTSGDGYLTGMDISGLTGTVICSNNTFSNITCNGDLEGINLSPVGSSGVFTLTNNTISGFTSGAGYIYGISGNIPLVPNTVQININKNTIRGLTSSYATGEIAAIYLFSGHSSATVSITSNKIFDLSETGAGSYVYGVFTEPTLAATVTYSNNYIGDLRAPLSNATNSSVRGMSLSMAAGVSNVYYNTIHLAATGSAATFTTAALYADASIALMLRNNIISNTSTAGLSGKTVAYWRSGTSLVNYNATSNNNVLYGGAPGIRNLVFYDGTNSDQTIAAYKTRVSPRDQQSINVLPIFISTNGPDATFLHLSPITGCELASAGNNAGILLATDFDGDSRMTSSPFLTDIGADEYSKVNVWTGANSNNWNDAGNWSEGVVPNDISKNVSISTPPVTQPLINAGNTFQVSNIILQPGASLTNRGTLQVSGGLYGATGSINNIQGGLAVGSIEMNGDCSSSQPLAGNVFVNNLVKDFKVSNDVTISSVNGEQLNIEGTLSFGAVPGKTLFTGDNVNLKSTANATANVANMTGHSISGKVTVERYVNTGLVADGRHPKSWQFLATPAKGQTIFQSWQESGTTPAGFGTIITGTGTGFDITTAQPSMKFFDPTIGPAGDWTGISNTGNVIEDQRGYMVFVRGDRTVITSSAAANPTTLRIKGNLFQPNDAPPVTTVLAGKIASVGNPYASAIDLDYMKNNGLFINLNNDVTVWDPLLYGSYGLGGYQTLSAANNYEPTAGSTATAYYPAGVPSPTIQSGQAFFVRSSGPAGSISFTEACKVNSNRLVNRTFNQTDKQFFRATLYTQSGLIADGNSVVFSPDYHNQIDADDSWKISNSGENFGMSREGKNLSVEARSMVRNTDTIFYRLSNLRIQPYRFCFVPKNMTGSQLTAVLVDTYLNSKTLLNLGDSNWINIQVTQDPLSTASGRFYVVFKKSQTELVKTIQLKAERNDDESVSLHWLVVNQGQVEKYEIERSFNGSDFQLIGTRNSFMHTDPAIQYDFKDLQPGTSDIYYRIRMIEANGSGRLSNRVKLEAKQGSPLISVYPNPVVNQTIQIHFIKPVGGYYHFALLNQAGQVIYKQQLWINETDLYKELPISQEALPGHYLLTCTTPHGKKQVIPVIFQKK